MLHYHLHYIHYIILQLPLLIFSFFYLTLLTLLILQYSMEKHHIEIINCFLNEITFCY